MYFTTTPASQHPSNEKINYTQLHCIVNAWAAQELVPKRSWRSTIFRRLKSTKRAKKTIEKKKKSQRLHTNSICTRLTSARSYLYTHLVHRISDYHCEQSMLNAPLRQPSNERTTTCKCAQQVFRVVVIYSYSMHNNLIRFFHSQRRLFCFFFAAHAIYERQAKKEIKTSIAKCNYMHGATEAVAFRPT